jgi:hypothetical protein
VLRPRPFVMSASRYAAPMTDFLTIHTQDNRLMRDYVRTADCKTETSQHWHDGRSRTRAAIGMRWSRSARFALTHAPIHLRAEDKPYLYRTNNPKTKSSRVLSRKRLVRVVPTSTENMPCRVGRFPFSSCVYYGGPLSDAVLNVIAAFAQATFHLPQPAQPLFLYSILTSPRYRGYQFRLKGTVFRCSFLSHMITCRYS